MSSPDRIGPWLLFEMLGRGGMGVVYRAVHATTGQEAALKTTVAATEGLLQGMRREIRELAEIDHPGVVRVLDHGADAGRPWYAMELLHGSTLRDRTRRIARSVTDLGPTAVRSGTYAEPRWTQDFDVEPDTAPPVATEAPPRVPAAAGDVPGVLRIVRDLCETLAWLHAEGLVHRDLKPDNVFLVDGERPVLVDFGLTARFAGMAGRERLEATAGSGLGTVDYIAPEQARGELVDARADLYAVGCLLFELLVGRAPFVGSTAAQIVAQHLDAPPTPPSELVDGVPPALDDLVMRLLAKEPHDRIGHADDVAEALVALGVPPTVPRPERRAWLFRPRLVGRHSVAQGLLDALFAADDGAGQLVLLGGESGVGKTRLALELAREARQRRLRVVVGENAEGARMPLLALRPALQALADRCREQGPEATLRAFGPGLRALAAFEPALADLPGFELAERPPELQPEPARNRLLSWIADALLAGAWSPLLIVIDDLQWADELTLDALERLARTSRFGTAPLMVLATWRTEEGTDAITRLAGLGKDHRLGRLDADGVASMAADMLAMPSVPPKLTRALATHSEGVPFYVAEYLRTAVAEGLLYRDGSGRWEVDGAEPSLPRALGDLVARRLSGLPAATLDTIAVAALLGRTFDEPLLAAVIGADPEAALRDAVKRHVLEVREDGALTFAHDKLREGARNGLSAARRAACDRAAALALEGRGGADHGALARIAGHWAGAGEAERARKYHLRAARAAQAAHALQAAAELFGNALEGLGSAAERALVRVELGAVLAALGRFAVAYDVHVRGLADAITAGDDVSRVTHRVGIAAAARTLGDLPRARSELEIAAREAKELGDEASERRVLKEQAGSWMDSAQIPEAVGAYEDLIARFRAEGNRVEEAAMLSSVGNAWSRRGDVARSLEALRAAEAVLEGLDETVVRTGLHGKFAVAYLDSGEHSRAAAHAQRSIELARATGQRRFEGISRLLLGFIAYAAREYGEAERHYLAAWEVARELAIPRDEAITVAHLADISAAVGRVPEARARYGEAARLQREQRAMRMLATTLVYLARLERRDGNLDRCEAHLDEAEALIRPMEDVLRLTIARAERGHLRLARGEDAMAILAEVAAVYAEMPAVEGHHGALQRAVAARAAGRPMHAGEDLDDLSESARRGHGISAATPAPGSPPREPR